MDYRLKVGNYRVVFDFEKKAKIISIEKIGVRNERTY
jgi:mRNA-degrading endonuclease RelE of RelBE toxin-antitoxin system